MALLLLLASVVSAAVFPTGDLSSYTFEQFLLDAGKSYTSVEHALRKQIFQTRLASIIQHNSQVKTWKQGVNQFMDMTDEEMRSLNGYNHGMARGQLFENSVPYKRISNFTDLPTQIDWRRKGVISPVKNQKSCGSCWAFASTETLESHAAIRFGQLPILSPQNIVDCAPNPNHCGGTGGCEGATAEVAYGWVQGSGIALEADYPYTAVDGACQTTKTPAAGVEYYIRLPMNDADAVAEALVNHGPLAVAVDASRFGFYSSGIFDDCSFSKSIDINHLVQLVGYGTEGGTDYWLIRNSWGIGWGEEGYIKLRRYPTGTCGVDKNPLDGSGCTGSPDQVTVCGNCGVVYDVVYPIPAVV